MADQYSTVSFQRLVDELTAAADWFRSLGVRVDPTRVGHYVRSLTELAQIHKTAPVEELKARHAEFLTALYEAHELVYIHAQLSGGAHDEYLRDRIKLASGGPINYADEVSASASNRARNFAFELLVMNRLVAAGLSLDHRIASDIAATFEGRTLLFECKRPQSQRSIEQRFSEARKQLRKKYSRADLLGCRGIVALDLTRLANPDFRILRVSDGQEISDCLATELKKFIDEQAKLWRSVRESKTIAVLVRVSIMAECRGTTNQMFYGQQYTLSPLPATGKENVEFARRLSLAWENAIIRPT